MNHTEKGDIEARNRSKFTMGLQQNSRVGVRWTRGDFFLHSELGLGGDVAMPAATLRLLYGDYKFAGGGFNNYEAVNRTLWALPQLKETGNGDMYNTTVYGGAIALNASGFEAGFGIQSARSDAWEDNQTGMGVYANYTYRISNFMIVPEVGYMHSGNRARTPGAPKDTRGLQAGMQFRFDI